MNHDERKEDTIKTKMKLLSRRQLERNTKNKFNKKYRKDISLQYNNKILEELIFNRKTHLIALFKEYMIADYIDEFLKREYKAKESKERIPKFSHYYLNYAIFFGMPMFIDFTVNEILKNFGEKKAEVYYNKHYKMIDEDDCINSDNFSNSSINEMSQRGLAMINKTIFNSTIKDNIDNATMFTNKNTDSNAISSNNTIQRIMNSTNRSKALNDSSITMNPDEIIISAINNNVVSNETSLISYIKLFSKHQTSKAKQVNRRIQVKKLCLYPPSTILTKRKNNNKDSDVGNGMNSETSNNRIGNQSISKLKGIISASNIYFNNTKQQLNKIPLQKKSNVSNNSNVSNHYLISNVSKKSLSVKRTHSRNVQNDLGYITDEIKHHNQLNIPITKTQKIDSIIRKYTINFSSKKLTCLKKKGVSQLSKKTVLRLNQHVIKGKTTNTFNSTNDKTKSKSKKRNQSKQSSDDLMKMALTLLMENKTSKQNANENLNANGNTNSNAHVNININNQININTNYPLQDSINTKLGKNSSVSMNINSNLSNLLKSNKHSRNKTTNGLVSCTDDYKTIASSTKGKLFSSYCLVEKKQERLTKKKDTPNTFNRPTSNDLLIKQNQQHPQYQQHQIQSYVCKKTNSKKRPKITSSSSNRLFQAMNQPLIVNTYTKNINSFKNQKP